MTIRYEPPDSGTTQAVPVVEVCEKCAKPLAIGDWPYCPHGSTLRYKPFPAFEVEGVGTIDSITKLREVERSSMEAYKEGRGQPLVFRAFTQDRSNQDSNVFGRPDQGARKRSNIRIRQVRG